MLESRNAKIKSRKKNDVASDFWIHWTSFMSKFPCKGLRRLPTYILQYQLGRLDYSTSLNCYG